MEDISLYAYKVWAPDDVLWTQWAKPVAFTQNSKWVYDVVIPQIQWTGSAEAHTMIILDLPGKAGVEEGIALAGRGYRPVPLYNGVMGPNPHSMIVNNEPVVSALFQGVRHLRSISISQNAPPVFLLDYNRWSGSGKQPGKFDNRWGVFAQDMPSASFLLKQGIRSILVRAECIKEDLSHILYRYQEQGLSVCICRDGESIQDMVIDKPSRFRSVFYRFKVTLGLTRNAAGGFGAVIPEYNNSRYRSG